VLLLRADGHSYKAICELTGRTYTWVDRHISEGRQALRLLVCDE
jgi:DNA-directed RNA polymerase specialized sigma24 family protein